MYFRLFISILLISFLATLQFALISSFSSFLSNLNLVLVVLIFILSLSSLEVALWWAVGLGFILDIFSFAPFGVFLLSLIFIVIVIDFLLENFFTNRSLYSFLALTILASIFYKFILSFVSYFVQSFIFLDSVSFFNFNFFIDLLALISLNSLATFVIFYVINFVSNKLKPAFLTKRTIK